MADLPAITADGNVKVTLVATIADTLAPTALECNGGDDIELYLTSDGLSPSLSEQTIQDERLGSTATYEQPGRAQRSLDVTYVDNTNSANANVAKDTLVPGVAQHLVIRRGKDKDTTYAAGDIVSVWPIKPGQYSDLPPEANSVLKTSQRLFVTGEVQVDVAVA